MKLKQLSPNAFYLDDEVAATLDGRTQVGFVRDLTNRHYVGLELPGHDNLVYFAWRELRREI